MSSRFNKMSEELFQILKGNGKTLRLFSDDGNVVYEPTAARKMFAEPDKMMLSIADRGPDSTISLYLSDTTDVGDIAPLIDTLRSVAIRYSVLLDVKKYGKELTPKDFAYQAIEEAAMWGSTKTSYQKIGSSKMIVRHCAPVKEDIMGSRSRNVLSIFIETKQGERFKFPVNHLSGARAWAYHLSEGGMNADPISQHVISLSEEAVNLAKVSRYIHYSRNALTEEAQGVRTVVRCRISEVRKELQSLSRPRGYKLALEANYEDKTIIKEDRQLVVDNEVARLSELLLIDANHALAEHLKPVALITLGENIMTNTNTKFTQILALESVDDLIETLSSEFGYEQGSHWELNESGFGVLPEILESVTSLLDLNETTYVIAENDDKFLAVAQQWMADRTNALSDAGEAEAHDGKGDAAVQDLANGLKDVFAGKKPSNAVEPAQMPGFANPVAKVAFKLGLYLEPEAKMQNDSMWNFIATMIEKLQAGKTLGAIEKMTAQKLLSMLEVNESFNENDNEMLETSEVDDAANDLVAILNKSPADVHNFLHGELQLYRMDGDSGTKNSRVLKSELDGHIEDNLKDWIYDNYGVFNANVGVETFDKVYDIVKSNIESRGWKVIDDVNETWASDDADPTSFKNGARADAAEGAESEIYSSFDKWGMNEFIDKHYKWFHDKNTDPNEEVSYEDIKGDLHGYLQDEVRRELDDDHYDLGGGMADELVGKVVAYAKANGWIITDEPATEAYGDRGMSLADTALSKHQDYLDDQDQLEADLADKYDTEYPMVDVELDLGGNGNKTLVHINYEYLPSDDDFDIKLVRLGNSPTDFSALIKQEHHSDILAAVQAKELAGYEEAKAKGLAESPVSVGDHVATDFGPGQVLELNGEFAAVEMRNGETKEIAVADLDLAGPALKEPKFKELAEMETWFEQFDANGILRQIEETESALEEAKRKKDKRHGLVGDVDSGGTLGEAREPKYFSVFELADGRWSHVFDADDKEDAAAEVMSIRNQGNKAKILRVAHSQANWGEMDVDAFVKSQLGEAELSEEIEAIIAEAGGIADVDSDITLPGDMGDDLIADVKAESLHGSVTPEENEQAEAWALAREAGAAAAWDMEPREGFMEYSDDESEQQAWQHGYDEAAKDGVLAQNAEDALMDSVDYDYIAELKKNAGLR